MWYEINVARGGQHLFATHERSLKDAKSANALLQEFADKFPECELTMTRYQTVGERLAKKTMGQPTVYFDDDK